ncbi:hypothetical protein NQ317_006622 [Molorchus minor]|uniref:Uncharacterized protein n=1 Tax=Molorchus minor TaxID=1323400 RepID=A0ABQ9JYY2_9CUCU|nr:hypothetical protein NQ317_006622 [Molorchus minor]
MEVDDDTHIEDNEDVEPSEARGTKHEYKKIDGNYPTLSTLLEKKGFIKSVISGLQYDSSDTVCVVISGPAAFRAQKKNKPVTVMLAQIVQFLVAPIPILKILLPENQTYELLSVKKHVISLILEILKSLELYLVSAKSWLSPDDQKKFKIHVTNHITRNFPDGKAILTDWDLSD